MAEPDSPQKWIPDGAPADSTGESESPAAPEPVDRKWAPDDWSLPAGDERRAQAVPAASVSLSELIAAGDEDAIAGFRDSHLHQVCAYCRETCASEAIDAACEATFLDFVIRVGQLPEVDVALDEVLLKATRSAAAGRFLIDPPPQGKDAAVCAAMPELLAAQANDELPGDESVIRAHLAHCVTCAAALSRMNRAEEMFASTTGWEDPAGPDTGEPEPEPETEPEPEPEPEPDAFPEPHAAVEPEPVNLVSERPPPASPAPPSPPASAPVVVRVRRRGLVGAAKRLRGQIAGKPRGRGPAA